MIIEKLLPQSVEDSVYELIASHRFPWYWNSENIVPEAPNDSLSQLTHMFIYDEKIPSVHWNSSVSLIPKYFSEATNLKIKKLKRVKANLISNLSYKKESLENLVHTDVPREMPGNFISFVYYVNDSDGNTVIFEDDKQTIVETSSPVKGNCVWFNFKTYHRSSIPSHHKRRIVINCILEVINSI